MSTPPLTRDELIEQSQVLVRSLALRVHRNIPVRVDLEDLIAYGELGLTEAAQDFDPSKGVQFSTFAYYRIRGAIYDGLSKMTWTSRAYHNRLRYERMATEVMRETKGPADAADRPTWFGNLTVKLGVVYLISNLDATGGIHDSALVDPRVPGPTLVARHEIAEILRALVDELPPTERRLIHSIYFEGATLQRAADQIGFSKSWASRIHSRVLEQLARALRQRGAADW